MASIERRQRGGRRAAVRWRVRWRDGDERERSKTFDTEREARRFKLRLEGDVAAGTWIDPANARIPLREFVDGWRRSWVPRPDAKSGNGGWARLSMARWGQVAGLVRHPGSDARPPRTTWGSKAVSLTRSKLVPLRERTYGFVPPDADALPSGGLRAAGLASAVRGRCSAMARWSCLYLVALCHGVTWRRPVAFGDKGRVAGAA